MKRLYLSALLVVSMGVVFAPATFGQKTCKDKKKVEPRVLMTLPLGSAPGRSVPIVIRGTHLDGATEVRFLDATVRAKIRTKGKAPAADKLPEKEGDSQVTADVVLPPGLTAPFVAFVVVTPEGQTRPHALLIESKLAVIQEKEPNDSFEAPQRIDVPQVIDGAIDHAQDVDVFAFQGRAGQRLVVEVLAAKYGSLLDPVLTLYDARGHQLACSEDRPGSAATRLDVTLPRTGSYYLTLMDAQDRGGVTFPYRLIVRTP